MPAKAESAAGPRDPITVVGAGLVGSLLSIYLARRGFEVDVFERRPDMRREKISAGRSINLAVSTRGLHALREVGLEDEILKQAIPMRGRMIHPRSGGQVLQPYGKDDSQYINSISRGGLNQVLMTRAEETGRVRIHFNAKAASADPVGGGAVFTNEAGGARLVRGPGVLLGTDGSASAVRHAMEGLPGHHGTQDYLDYAYKELVIPAGPGGTFRLEKHALHIWPRGTFMLIALPNFDGSFTCTLFLPQEGAVSFARLAAPADVTAFFRAEFPDALPLMSSLETDFFANPTGQMVTVKCFPWSAGGRTLLLGDAAHAIVPFFGQGMNCGFEDCSVLDGLLEAHGPDWARVFPEFERLRKENADAIADMAVENFVEMRDKVGNPRFLLEKEVEKILLREFPGEFASRYSLVTFSRVPYRFALEIGRIGDGILGELAEGLTEPAKVDLEKAARLIRERMTPRLRGGTGKG